jgi:hypothetical protein
MSSVYRALASIDKPPTKFSALITPSYNYVIIPGDPDITIEMPIPFTVENGVLDINVNQSTKIQTFVNAGTSPINQAEIQGKAFGGAKVVTSFGPNMTTYLRNWINTLESSISAAYTGPLVLYIQPLMTKVQLANPAFSSSNGAFRGTRSWGVSTEAPVSTEYTGGESANNFFTAWIFKTPMTIEYVIGGVSKYITMTSQFAEE